MVTYERLAVRVPVITLLAILLVPVSMHRAVAVVVSISVANPSFEQPALNGTLYTTGFGATSLDPATIPGWVLGLSGGVSYDGIVHVPDGVFAMTAPPDGVQAAFLQGTGSCYQVLNGFNDGYATVSFYAAGRTTLGPNPVQVWLDGTPLTFSGSSTASPAANQFSLFTTDAVAVTAGVHTLKLSGTVPFGQRDLTTFVDKVSVANGSGAPPPPPPAPVKIYPLGDSITYGDSGPYRTPGGYRNQLYTQLNNAGVDFRFVGSSTDNSSTALTAAGQASHDGHPGWTINNIAAQADGWLAAYQPNIILLQIGTNDILWYNGTAGQMKTDLTSLINRILTDAPNSSLLLSTITPIQPIGSGLNGDGTLKNPTAIAYNELIRNEIVPAFQADGKPVILVDQYANFVDAEGNLLTALFGDYYHPNEAGYAKMGDTWFAAIESVSAVPEPSTWALLLCGAVGAVAVWRRK